MNPWRCLIKAISLWQRLIAWLFSILYTKVHRGGVHLSIIDFYHCMLGKKMPKKVTKYKYLQKEKLHLTCWWWLWVVYNKPFVHFENVFFCKNISLSPWQAGHICISAVPPTRLSCCSQETSSSSRSLFCGTCTLRHYPSLSTGGHTEIPKSSEKERKY